MMNNDAEFCEEYFGPVLGQQSFYQYSYGKFQIECLAINAAGSDATGKRLYSGGHVGIRFLSYLRSILQKKAVLELGCGTGIIGLSLLLHSDTLGPTNLVLTDGATTTLPIALKNRDLVFNSREISSSKCSVQHLFWGNEEQLKSAIFDWNSGQFYDVIIGFELMYYNTDLPLLFHTLKQLMHPTHGIFIHVHHFRRENQEQELITLCQQYDWMTVEVSKSTFIDEIERKDHPEWYHMRALITGKAELIHEVLTGLNIPYFPFRPELVEEEEDDGDDDTYNPHHKARSNSTQVDEQESLSSLFQV